MGLIKICPCECSATITAQQISNVTETLNADICPTCEAGGTVTFTVISADELFTISFQSSEIMSTSCEVTDIGTTFVVSGKGMARIVDLSQGTDTTFTATFSLNLTEIDDTIRVYFFINGVRTTPPSPSFFEWQTFYTNDAFRELEASVTECPPE